MAAAKSSWSMLAATPNETAWASDRPTYQPQMTAAPLPPPPAPPPAEPAYKVDFNDRQAQCYKCCLYSVIIASTLWIPCIPFAACCLGGPQRATIDDDAVRYNDAPPVRLRNVTRVALSRNVCCGCVEAPAVTVSATGEDESVSMEAPRRARYVRDEIVRRWEKAVLRDGRGSDGGSADARVELTSWSAWATSTWAKPPPDSVTLDGRGPAPSDTDTTTPVVLSFDERAAIAHLTCKASLIAVLSLICIPILPCLPCLAASQARHQRCVIDDRAIRVRQVPPLCCIGCVSESWMPLDKVAAVQVTAPWGATVVSASPDVRNVYVRVEGGEAFTSMVAVRGAAAVKDLIEVRKMALKERIWLISRDAVGLDDAIYDKDGAPGHANSQYCSNELRWLRYTPRRSEYPGGAAPNDDGAPLRMSTASDCSAVKAAFGFGSENCCGFLGDGDSWEIICDSNGRVTYVDFPIASMQGGIPTQVFQLSELVELDLTQNYYTGTIPVGFGALTKLRTLIVGASSPPAGWDTLSASAEDPPATSTTKPTTRASTAGEAPANPKTVGGQTSLPSSAPDGSSTGALSTATGIAAASASGGGVGGTVVIGTDAPTNGGPRAPTSGVDAPPTGGSGGVSGSSSLSPALAAGLGTTTIVYRRQRRLVDDVIKTVVSKPDGADEPREHDTEAHATTLSTSTVAHLPSYSEAAGYTISPTPHATSSVLDPATRLLIVPSGVKSKPEALGAGEDGLIGRAGGNEQE
ncbi:hypothetical protein DFJ73DRAFT_786256 [Zopfochytrium polystomum]|nr:hypothetical protein DFJ73DRAFT_786256 [Zopfochytrium polystomum]